MPIDEDFSKSVMVALLPTVTDWCHIDLPHMTLVYAGLIKDLKETAYNELAKDASSISMSYPPITLKIIGVEIFGDTDKVDVFRLESSKQLLSMRKLVESWNASDYDFNPHVTIGPVGTVVKNPPTALTFNRVMVNWGDEELTFWMKQQ